MRSHLSISFLGVIALAVPTPATAQCHEANMSCSNISTSGFGNTWAIKCRSTSAVTITGVTVRSRSSSSATAGGQIELWLTDANGFPMQRVAFGAVRIPPRFGNHRGCFSTPYQMPANTDYAIAFALGGALDNRCTSGTDVTYHWRRSQSDFWRGPFAAPFAFRVECTPCTPSTEGTYTTVGLGCPGTVVAPGCCEGEMSCTTSTGNQAGGAFYALQCTAATARDVTGITLRTQSTGGNQAGRIELWSTDTAGEPQRLLNSGRIVIGPSYGDWTGTFSRPTRIPGGAQVAAVFSLPGSILPTCTTGSGRPPTYWFRQTATSPWQGPGSNLYWSYRLECTNVEAYSPTLFASGPVIETTWTASVSRARPSTQAFLTFGISKNRWGAFQLPLNLAPFGAPLCSVQCSIDVVEPTTTDANGTGRISIDLPASRALVGIRFCNQWVVLDPGANGLGVAFSGCGDATVGG